MLHFHAENVFLNPDPSLVNSKGLALDENSLLNLLKTYFVISFALFKAKLQENIIC